MSTITDFDEVVKHLDIVPSQECPDGISPERIYKRPSIISSSRDIKKLQQSLIIPAFDVYNYHPDGLLIGQFNYTVSNPFYITQFSLEPFTSFPIVFHTIRWLKAGVVHRYVLPRGVLNSPTSGWDYIRDGFPAGTGIPFPYYPDYSGQKIEPSFAIEVWKARGHDNFIAPNAFSYTLPALEYKSSFLQNPTTPDQLVLTGILPSITLLRADLDEPLPETLPTQYNANARWINNL